MILYSYIISKATNRISSGGVKYMGRRLKLRIIFHEDASFCSFTMRISLRTFSERGSVSDSICGELRQAKVPHPWRTRPAPLDHSRSIRGSAVEFGLWTEVIRKLSQARNISDWNRLFANRER